MCIIWGATIALQTSIMKRYKASTNSSNCHSPDKFSDHSAVACTLNTSIPFKRKPRCYDILRSELQELQPFFQSTSEDTDSEGDWELFKSALKTSVDRNIP